ncbi:protein containing PKD domain-containing protein [Polaribacter sp. ALD11]|uniref:DUF4625 domain-containing protein n=1 Tax=Polaribacter sp. ALD11 TaxID=2058137 RepID=UPI000C30C63C|nr:DUF4625 domain-containing protein [Polaribacter sp. ALD11]AUC84278.1 protein containing PKD domain-containing protein [Polaribacter sp. ALD11]
MKTKIMKSNFKLLAVIAFVGITLQSCNNEENIELNAPLISNFEYGEGSTHTTDKIAYKGSDIHLEAEINAEAIVSKITLSIHAHDLTTEDGEEEWEFEKVFTDAKYLVINPTFHEHVDVPANIPAGEYHVELTVTDELGNSTEVEGHIQVLDVVTLSAFSIDTTVARGKDFHAEFMVDAVHGIHSISVDVHAHGLTVGAGEVAWDFEKEYLGSYHEKTSVEFHEHIDVPATAPVGEYHIIFTVKDEDGNMKEYETHIDVTV